MKRVALSGVVLSAALAVGTAQAEPLTLSADQMDRVTAAGVAFVRGDKILNILENVRSTTNIAKLKQVLQRVDVQGFFAHADGAANCRGVGCEAGSFAITDTNFLTGIIAGVPFGTATSVSGSEAATSGFVRPPLTFPPFFPPSVGPQEPLPQP